jgi:hypothetical protein
MDENKHRQSPDTDKGNGQSPHSVVRITGSLASGREK